MPKSPVRSHDAEHFGAIIRRLRQQRGWTIIACARRLDMNANYLGSLEKGGNMPSMETLFEIAAVFGTPAWEIVREVEERRNGVRPAGA
jgi:transcriptional regulator with XRE-family HTH domain